MRLIRNSQYLFIGVEGEPIIVNIPAQFPASPGRAAFNFPPPPSLISITALNKPIPIFWHPLSVARGTNITAGIKCVGGWRREGDHRQLHPRPVDTRKLVSSCSPGVQAKPRKSKQR